MTTRYFIDGVVAGLLYFRLFASQNNYNYTRRSDFLFRKKNEQNLTVKKPVDVHVFRKREILSLSVAIEAN